MYKILVNGQETTDVDVNDRGFNYGDGLFETIAVRGGQPLLWRRHMVRLGEGCERLGIAAPDGAVLDKEARQLCDGVDQAVLKIIVTRGVGGRGYSPAGCGRPTRVTAVYPWPQYPPRFFDDGVALRLCRTRLATGGALTGLKHLNRLEQVLARGEWDDPAVPEGLMLDGEDHIVEGTMTNVFMVFDGVLTTPALDRAGVAGVMRGLVLDTAQRAGIACSIRDISLQELSAAEEVFVCNSVIGVWPVISVDRRVFSPGPVTRRIAESVYEISRLKD